MKTTRTVGYRVVIDVPRRIFGLEKNIDNQRREAHSIVDQVRRHVDCDPADVDVEPETEAVCSYCDSPWTEESETYNGGCCALDERRNPSAEVVDGQDS